MTAPGSVPPPSAGWFVKRNRVYFPSEVTMTLVGAEPTIRAGSAAVPSGASLALSGAAPTVRLGQNFIPTPLALALTTFAPNVITPYVGSPAGLNMAITGHAPYVHAPVMPTGASMTLTGHAPRVELPQGIGPQGAALALTGAAPTVRLGINAAPSGASLTLTGSAPTVSTPRLVQPSAASLAITGSAPTVAVASVGVAYDATGAGNNTTNTSTSTNITWSHTCSGSDRIVIVVFQYYAPTTASAFTVTYGGTAMTGITSGLYAFTPPYGGTGVYYLLNPPTGAQTVSVTMPTAAGAGNRYLAGNSVSYTGVSYAGIDDLGGTNLSDASPGTAMSYAAKTTYSDSWFVNVFAQLNAAAITGYTGGTSRFSFTNPNSSNMSIIYGDAPGPTSGFSATRASGATWSGMQIVLHAFTRTKPTYVSSAAANGTSIGSMPSHQAGDYIFIAAFRDGSTTAPSLPGGFTNLASGGDNTCSIRLGYKIAASGAETSGTWTNATITMCCVMRNVNSLGGAGRAGGNTSLFNNLIGPNLTFTNTKASSIVVAFAGHRDTAGTAVLVASNKLSHEGSTADGAVGVADYGKAAGSMGGTYSSGTSGFQVAAVECIPA